MASIWPANVLTGGGTGALDAIDGALLSDGDGAIVIAGTIAYFYSLNATSGAAEASPSIITPDINAGSQRWILQKVSDQSNAISLNKSSITSNWEIPSGYHGVSVGPLDIDADITISENSVWEVL